MNGIFRNRRTGRRIRMGMTVIVSAAMMASAIQVPVYAAQNPDGSVNVNAVSESVNEKYDDIEYNGTDHSALYVSAGNGNTATVEAGDINVPNLTDYGPTGETVVSNDGGKADVATGSISSGSSGLTAIAGTDSKNDITVDGDIDAETYGVSANVIDDSNGSNTVTVSGNVTAKQGDGISVINNGNSDARTSVSVEGDVAGNSSGVRIQTQKGITDVTVNGDVESGGIFGGINAGVYEGGDLSVNVSGDVTSTSQYGGAAVAVGNGSSYPARNGGTANITTGNVKGNVGVSSITDKGGRTDITVNGNVESDWVGLNIYNMNNSTTKIAVDGDVTSNTGCGIWANADGGAEVIIDGTLKGQRAAIDLTENSRDVKLTVWKIEPGDEGNIAMKEGPGEAPEQFPYEEFEKTIQYMIKLQQPREGDILRVTDENGNPLSTIEGLGRTYEYAYEGDKVLLKVDVPVGYELTGAFNNDGGAVPLLQNADGNYYIQVPRGGGVLLSVTLDLATVHENTPSVAENPATGDNTGAAGCDCGSCTSGSCSDMVSQIVSAPVGGGVSLWVTSGTTICPCSVSALLARSDLAVTVMFVLDGVTYSVTIPAGANLASLMNGSGGIDLITLVTAFGATPI